MTTYEITYKRTGTVNQTDKIWIHTGEEKKDGTKIHNITDAIEAFEEIAAGWGSYENRNAIENIAVSGR